MYCVLEPLVSVICEVCEFVYMLSHHNQSERLTKFSGWKQIPGSKKNEMWFNRDGGKQKKIRYRDV